jgi:hypothetical protein
LIRTKALSVFLFNSEKYKKNPQTITQSELIRSGWKWMFDVTLYDVCYELTQTAMVDGKVFTEIYYGSKCFLGLGFIAG